MGVFNSFAGELLLLTFMFCCCADGQALGADKVASVLEQAFSCYNNPGLAVSVVKDGQVIFSRGFGVKNLETKEPVTENTVFGLASVSKSFAATLLVKLLDESANLTVDSKVRELLGDEFKLHDEFRTMETTFADILGHRMAIPANNRIRYDTNLTRDSLLGRLSLLESKEPFRVKYIYSNLFYGLATHLAERLGSGQSWEELVRKHLLQPLGMDSTVFATTADLESMTNLARGYLNDGDDLVPLNFEFSRRWGLLAGSGAVMSTASDMTKWMNFHLQKGLGSDGNRVMKEDLVEEVHTARMLTSFTSSLELREPEFPVTSTHNIYAHGFRRGFYRGFERLAHSGSTAGYRAFVTLLPSPQIGVFTAITGGDTAYTFRSGLHYYLLDWALGLEQPWLNATTMCSFPEPWKRRSSPESPPELDADFMPDVPVTQFEGTYHNEVFGNLQVSYNKTAKTFFLTYGWGRWQLFYQGKKGSNELKFYGKPADFTTLRLSTLYFIHDTHNGEDRISKIKATSFESSMPPMFSKVGLENEDSSGTSRLSASYSRSIFSAVFAVIFHISWSAHARH